MSSPEPVFRVVRGTPTAEEVAALVGVLLTRAAPPAPVARRSRWAMGALPAGGSWRPIGADGWRSSNSPR